MGKTTYSKKRNATRKKIESVFIENFRSSGDAELTVKEICERADINRSTFYVYYRDTSDLREQIENSLISQFEERMASVLHQHFDDPDMIMIEIMEFNRNNAHLPLLLISAGSSSFVYRISKAATEIIAGTQKLTDEGRDKITMLFTYHFAGISMVMRQMMENTPPSDESYERMTKRLIELILPVVKNGLLPTIKDLS